MGEENNPSYLPKDAESLFQRGVALYQHGDVDGAIKALDSATIADPMHAQAWCYLGLIQLAIGNPNDAVIAFGSSIKANELNPEAYIGLGFSLARQADEENSENCFKQAMLQTTFDAEPWVFVGEFLAPTNIVEADFCFNSALNIDPGNKDAQQGLQDLFNNPGKRFALDQDTDTDDVSGVKEPAITTDADDADIDEETSDDDDDLDDDDIDDDEEDEDDDDT